LGAGVGVDSSDGCASGGGDFERNSRGAGECHAEKDVAGEGFVCVWGGDGWCERMDTSGFCVERTVFEVEEAEGQCMSGLFTSLL